MRIATYNVEWFTRLFDRKNRLEINNEWSARYNVTKAQQIAALGMVFQRLNADAILIIEAPGTEKPRDTVEALQNFAKHFGLRQNKVLVGFANDTQQQIALLYDPDGMQVIHDPLGDETSNEVAENNARFDGVFKRDLDTDDQPETIVFSKPPLEVALIPKYGPPLRLIGVHVKSKSPYGARNKRDEVRIAIENRRKQLAQTIWLRQRIDSHLDIGDRLIVMGDFNDGPGLDEYEELFGQSAVELALGLAKPQEKWLFDPHAQALMSPRRGPLPSTSRFYIHTSKTYLNALLDYIMISQDLQREAAPQWKIWHPFDDPQCFTDKPICQALLTASDHFPVTIDLDFGKNGENQL